MTGPFIFISAVTAEFKTTRQRVANALTRLGYRPVWQEIFGTEPGDLRQMLREKIDDCEGLIQIAGEAYGAEPPTVDADFGRVSYTQFEFLYARRKEKKTWLIFPGPACTRDKPLDQLDLPCDTRHPDPKGFQAERRKLQADYQQALRQSEHLWHVPVNDTDLELKTERMKDEFYGLRRGFQRWQNRVLGGIMLALGLLVGVICITWVSKKDQQRRFDQITAGQNVTTTSIRAHLFEASERRRKEDLVRANQASDWEMRDQLREVAEHAHQLRLSRIDEVAASFTQLESRTDVTTASKELARILEKEGVDAALAYVARHRGEILSRVRNRVESMREQNRVDLLPLLKGAGLQAAKGETQLARDTFQQIVDLDPTWPEATRDFVWFLLNQSMQSQRHRTLNEAIADARQALQLADRLNSFLKNPEKL